MKTFKTFLMESKWYLPKHVQKHAEEMLRNADPKKVGDSKVVDNHWIETHTLGCREAADEEETNWWDSHYKIYDEYKTDKISKVIGDPTDGKFVTINRLRKNAKENS